MVNLRADLRAGACCVGSGEGDFGGLFFCSVGDFEELGGLEAEHAGKNHVGEDFAGGVVGHDGVVVSLTGECDAVFCGGEFFAQLHHVLVGFEVGVVFCKCKESAQGTAEHGFRSGKAGDDARRCGVGGGGLACLHGGGTGLDDGFECAAFVAHVGFGGFDEVGDEVVAAFELHIDLGEGVFEAVAQLNQVVVDADDEECERNYDDEQNAAENEQCKTVHVSRLGDDLLRASRKGIRVFRFFGRRGCFCCV